MLVSKANEEKENKQHNFFFEGQASRLSGRKDGDHKKTCEKQGTFHK